MSATTNTPKKVLLVHSTLHIGGAEEVTANLCRKIDKSQFELSVCYLKERGVIGDRIAAEGTSVSGIKRNDRLKMGYLSSLQLRKLIKRGRFDLIHSHDVHAFADCSVCKITMPGIKYVHTFHYGNYPKRAKEFARIEKLMWRVPDQLVSVSEQQKKGLSELYGIPCERIRKIWNGVDLMPPTEPVKIIHSLRNGSRVIIGSINTLIEQKGMDNLIDTALLLRNNVGNKFVFLVAGDGRLREHLESRVRVLGMGDCVIFLGWLNNASSSLLPYIDIFFQPSLWEAMSMVLLEAMAAGKPIVATSVGETPLIIHNEIHGCLVESGNVSGMAAMLEKLINDKTRCETFGRAARERYLESFTADKMAYRYQQLYNDLLS